MPADELRSLLAEPLDRFVAARNVQVKALRAEGRREEAALLATVRKPGRLVAALGDLARADPGAAAALIEAAEDMEAAQAGDGDLREAMTALRPAIDEVLASASARDRVDLGVPLRTVLADSATRSAWLDGLLTELPGPDAATATPPVRHLALVPTASDANPATNQAAADTEAAGAARRAEGERRAAEARAEARRVRQVELDEAARAVDAATGELDRATGAQVAAHERLAAARREVEAAEEWAASVDEEVVVVEHRLGALTRSLAEAGDALDHL